MVDTKNILIIGKVGSGKSALANVLSGTEVFKEDSSSVAEIWRAKNKEFEENEIKYRVIDTIGLGDTKLTKEELLEKFEEEVGTYIDEGISQIFFVIEKLNKKVLDEFLYLNESLFDNKALDYTTIVRTNFADFRSKEKCQEDIEKLATFFNEKQGYKEISNKVLGERKIICVDNPPIRIDKKLRQRSRKKLLEYLNESKNKVPYKSDTRKWLDENYPFENERKEMLILDVSGRNLKGRLNLKGFTNLERLNCSNNELTSLNLSDCPNLIELKCNNNQLTNLNFLKSVNNLEKLEIQNNQNLSSQSLRVLENLNKLEELNINNTNLSEEWEYLLKTCRKLYCNSKEITKQLDKKNCSNDDESGKKYYNLDKWRKTNEQNKSTASVVPLERLYVIRSNIKKFVIKWGVKEDDNENKSDSKLKKYLTWSYDKVSSKLWKKDESNLTELSKLKDPKDYSWQWRVNATVQWTNRSALVVGGSLVLIGQSDTDNPNSQLYSQTGGVIAIASPFVEILTSCIDNQIYETKEKQWEKFVEDTKNLLDNYHELLGILKKIKKSETGEVNKALNNLRVRAKEFLDEYDKEKNGRKNGIIDINELVDREARIKFAEDLDKENKEEGGGSKLGDIVKAIESLEEEVYRQGIGEKEVNKEPEKLENKEEVTEEVIPQKEDYQTIDLDKHFESKIEFPSKNI